MNSVFILFNNYLEISGIPNKSYGLIYLLFSSRNNHGHKSVFYITFLFQQPESIKRSRISSL